MKNALFEVDPNQPAQPEENFLGILKKVETGVDRKERARVIVQIAEIQEVKMLARLLEITKSSYDVEIRVAVIKRIRELKLNEFRDELNRIFDDEKEAHDVRLAAQKDLRLDALRELEQNRTPASIAQIIQGNSGHPSTAA